MGSPRGASGSDAWNPLRGVIDPWSSPGDAWDPSRLLGKPEQAAIAPGRGRSLPVRAPEVMFLLIIYFTFFFPPRAGMKLKSPLEPSVAPESLGEDSRGRVCLRSRGHSTEVVGNFEGQEVGSGSQGAAGRWCSFATKS